jgi:hypothetical protein
MVRALGLLLVAISLGACQGIRDQFGLTKQSPDEFRVVARAPLSLPPDFNLRPPAPGAPRPQEGTATDQARTAVFRNEEATNTASLPSSASSLSAGEQALLRQAGAPEADPAIRGLVDRETAEINEDATSFMDALIFWREAEQPGLVIDAEAENRRLRENEALGEPVTAGGTPTIERREKAIFEDIF